MTTGPVEQVDPKPFPFSDRPCRFEVNRFGVANVPGGAVHPHEPQFEAVLKIARFDTYEEAMGAAKAAAYLLTGDERLNEDY